MTFSQIQFFTWNGRHPDMSWWQHLAAEAPRLAELGFTQIWLPPAHKALSKVKEGFIYETMLSNIRK